MARAAERSLGTVAALLAVDLGVRCLGYGTMRRLLRCRRRPEDVRTLTGADRAAARRLAARVEGSSSLRVYRVPCLPRALLLERMLTARGLPARLRIGVRRTAGTVRAHAWVECADQVLDPDPLVERRFPTLTP
ncbi:MAG: lasso peptide biosynthesis B2 protein [Thermoanaerobaculia bacterium]